MNTEQRILCLASRTELTPGDEARLLEELRGPVDWEYLNTLSRLHQVWPLLDLNVRRLKDQAPVPVSWLEQSQRLCRLTLFDNAFKAYQLLRVVRGVQSIDIECIPVKGIVVAETLYGDLALRPAADLDVLVRQHDLPQVRSILNALGFIQETTPDFGHVHHALHDPPYVFEHGSQRVRLDLHWTLWASYLFPIDITTVWERATLSQLRGVPLWLLSPEDTLLHLAIHRSRSAIRLRLICDIAELLRRYGHTLDWDYVLRQAAYGAARTALYSSLLCARELLGAPLPAGTLSRLGIGPVKARSLDVLWGPRAMFRPPTPNGSIRELSFAQRFAMLDDSRQIIRGLGYRTVRAAKYLKSLVDTSNKPAAQSR